MTTYRTPGVYVEEDSKLPPSVAGVATAIPAFIGYTEKGDPFVPQRITSLVEYQALFGGAPKLSVPAQGKINQKEFVLYDSLRLFFDNGGFVCYIVSAGTYKAKSDASSDGCLLSDFITAFSALEKVDEVTLLVFPDAVTCLDAETVGQVQDYALAHCDKMRDRFAILDVPTSAGAKKDSENFRDYIGSKNLMYGAAYYPYIKTSYLHEFTVDDVFMSVGETLQCDKWVSKKAGEITDTDVFKNAEDKEAWVEWTSRETGTSESEESEEPAFEVKKVLDKDEEDLLKMAVAKNDPRYESLLKALQDEVSVIPPSGAIAGIIADTDTRMGVWNAPANLSITGAKDVSVLLSDFDQGDLNVDPVAGKSINAIRKFTGKGILVWGARTLAALSNEWKYIPVRRLFTYVEESVQKSTAWAVFQPNDLNTWVKIKGQITSFLNGLWRDGALAGATPEQAFFVNVGLGSTMTSDDILQGNLIVEIGLAAVRPAEFIILRFSHKVQE